MSPRLADRVLRALARFDVATATELALVLNCGKRTAWAHLQAFVMAGLATRQGDCNIRYAITDAGRAAIASAA